MKFEKERSIEKLTAEELVEKLRPELEGEAARLESLGFEVGEDCRIDPEAFHGVLPVGEIEGDLKRVKETEKRFEKGSAEGELLETLKTLGVNDHWFGGRFVSLRTAKYDDIFNGVDNLIIDTKTFEPIAAVDTTINFRDKAKELQRKIEKGSAVKYGFGLSEKGVEKKSYKNLPLFIISFPKNELGKIVEDFKTAEERLRSDLKLQSELFPREFKNTNPEVKAAYERIGKILEELPEEESD